MKRILLLALFGLFALAGANAQFGTPADTFGFIDITIKNIDDSPYANQPVVLRSNRGHVVTVTTNAKGWVKATVPFNANYTVFCGEHQCRDTVKVQNFPYVTHKFQGYSSRGLILNFICKSPTGKPLDGEVLQLEDSKGELRDVTMDANGKASLTLPFGAYQIHAKYLPYVHKVVGDTQYERHIINIPITWLGTKETERRAFVADSLARIEHARLVALLDSLAKISEAEAAKRFVEEGMIIPVCSNMDVMERLILKKAEAYKTAYAKNPKIFEEKEQVVLAALLRLAPIVPTSIVVTDITGSMSPYMEQVMLWHALNFADNKTLRYVFFNDGDEKPDASKVIGKTGGLYSCQGNVKDLKTVIHTIEKGSNAGGGGDAEENDLEAVLAAHGKVGAKGNEPIILIADNNSPVRDISLLSKVKVPVHVILCGGVHINEEYLEIALRTGGSVHTIEESIMDLSKRKEGETIRLNGVEYIFREGHFQAK